MKNISWKLIWCFINFLNWHTTVSLQNFSQTKIPFLRAVRLESLRTLLFHRLLTVALALEPLVLKLDFFFNYVLFYCHLCLNWFEGFVSWSLVCIKLTVSLRISWCFYKSHWVVAMAHVFNFAKEALCTCVNLRTPCKRFCLHKVQHLI